MFSFSLDIQLILKNRLLKAFCKILFVAHFIGYKGADEIFAIQEKAFLRNSGDLCHSILSLI